MLPNTFIAGAQKSGTTTICALLSQHPACVLSVPKEPTFFCKADNLDHVSSYEGCFNQSGKPPRIQCIIDGSTAYMVDPLVPQRIYNLLGDDLYFVFSLRRPADRTISAYWQLAKKGYERREINDALMFESTRLEEALIEEEEKIKKAVKSGHIDLRAYINRYDDPLWNFRYLRNSNYRPDLERYFKIFRRDRISIVIFDDLMTDTLNEVRRIADFLGMDSDIINAIQQMHHNPVQLLRGGDISRKLIAYMRRAPRRKMLRKIPGFSAVCNIIYSENSPAIHENIIERITDIFNSETKKLSELIGRNLQVWTQ